MPTCFTRGHLQSVGPDTPMVGVLVHGGTLGLGDALPALDAVLDAWYPGVWWQEGKLGETY